MKTTNSLAKGTRVYAEGIGLGRVEKVSHRKGVTYYMVGCSDTVGVYAEHEVLPVAASPEFAALVAEAARTHTAVQDSYFDGEIETRLAEHKQLVTADDEAYRAVRDTAAVLLSAQKSQVSK